MRLWGVNDWDLITGSSSAKLTYKVNGRYLELACDKYPTNRQNARAIYALIDSLRLGDQRGMLQEMVQQATALLEAGRPKGRPAHEVLGVFPDADIEVAEAAFKALARKRHPDRGGTEAAMKELTAAIEEFRKQKEKRP
jgi:DnaJ-domain-containing protein 1